MLLYMNNSQISKASNEQRHAIKINICKAYGSKIANQTFLCFFLHYINPTSLREIDFIHLCEIN
jgi:hypothetical protein